MAVRLKLALNRTDLTVSVKNIDLPEALKK